MTLVVGPATSRCCPRAAAYWSLTPRICSDAWYRVSGPGNYTKWEDSRIEDLFQQQTRISDRDERRVLALQAADILLEEAYTIGMYFVIRPMFLSNIVQNFNISPTAYTQNYKWEHIWCDPTCSDS